MATIKAGIYRFNDVLTVPSGAIDQSISFSLADSDIEITQEIADMVSRSYGITVPVGSFTLSGSFSGIITNDVNTGNYLVVDYNDGVFRVDDDRYNALVHSFLADGDKEVYSSINGYWDVGSVPNPQTITILIDTDVTPEFYEWFIANAKRQISGVWKFNDELTPSVQETITQSINFTADFTDSYFGGDGSTILHGVCSKIFYSNIEGDLGYTFDSTVPDLSSYGLTYPMELWMHGGGGWADELCKTIDFGTEPQYVSVEFYEWFVQNASPIIKAGMYRFNDKLVLPNETIYQPLNLTNYGYAKIYSQNACGMCDRVIVYWDGMSVRLVSTEPNFEDLDFPFGFIIYYDGDYYEDGEYLFSGWNTYASDERLQLATVIEDSTVSEEFASWFNKNAKLVSATIQCDGYNIAGLVEGQTATISCGGKFMKSDIVVAFGGDGTITYNGTETAVEGGKTATLPCEGKVMKSDIVITI